LDWYSQITKGIERKSTEKRKRKHEEEEEEEKEEEGR
jgi:hypothetical protein